MKKVLIWSIIILIVALVVAAILQSIGAPALLVKTIRIICVCPILVIGKQIILGRERR